jgi:hypothetical protein
MAILPSPQQQSGSKSSSSSSSSNNSSSCWDVDWAAAGEVLQAACAEGFTLAGFRVVSQRRGALASDDGNAYCSRGSAAAGNGQQQQQSLQQLVQVLKPNQQQAQAVRKGPLLVLALAKENAVVRLQACMAAAVQQQQQAAGRDESCVARATASLAAVAGCLAPLPGSSKAAEQQVLFFFDEVVGCGASIVHG